MNKRLKRSPGDYPLFAFRLSLEQKEKLNGMVEDVQVALNSTTGHNERRWRKNELFYEAMMIGLPIVEKKFGSKRSHP